jgi:hypothetical protein
MVLLVGQGGVLLSRCVDRCLGVMIAECAGDVDGGNRAVGAEFASFRRDRETPG